MSGPWAGRLLDALTALDPVDAPVPYALTPAAHLVIAAPTAADAGHAAGSRPDSTNDVPREDLTVTRAPTALLLVCEPCRLLQCRYLPAEEADQAAAVHDDTCHGGQPTARIETDPATVDQLVRSAR